MSDSYLTQSFTEQDTHHTHTHSILAVLSPSLAVEMFSCVRGAAQSNSPPVSELWEAALPVGEDGNMQKRGEGVQPGLP